MAFHTLAAGQAAFGLLQRRANTVLYTVSFFPLCRSALAALSLTGPSWSICKMALCFASKVVVGCDSVHCMAQSIIAQ